MDEEFERLLENLVRKAASYGSDNGDRGELREARKAVLAYHHRAQAPAPAHRDAERLEWMCREQAYIGWGSGGCRALNTCTDRPYTNSLYPDERAAIDAAIAAAPSPLGGGSCDRLHRLPIREAVPRTPDDERPEPELGP